MKRDLDLIPWLLWLVALALTVFGGILALVASAAMVTELVQLGAATAAVGCVAILALILWTGA